MTDEERELRRKLAGLGTSRTRTRFALDSAGGPTAQRLRVKLAAVEQQQNELRKRLHELNPENMRPDCARFPILLAADASPDQFVAFWDRMYTGYDNGFYTDNIGEPLTPELVKAWFEWKNGTILSPKKAKSILRYSLPEEQVPADADEEAVEEYLKRRGGAVWRIFYLHIQHPRKWPIYDQHVHRAMAAMRGWTDLEIPQHNPSKVRMYLQEYVPFFDTFKETEHRRVDRALWAYGKFLKTEWGEVLRPVQNSS